MKKFLTWLFATIAAVTLLYLTLFKIPSLEKKLKDEKATTDSIKAVNADYATMVIPCVPDTLIKLQIPKTTKLAWLEYCRAVKIATDSFERIETIQSKIQAQAIAKADEKLSLKKKEADAYYDKVQRQAFLAFAKDNDKFNNFVSNLNSFENSYVYLGSTDSYWSVTVNLDFNNLQTNEKCPEAFKVMLTKCKEADTVAKNIEAEATKVFEQERVDAKLKYELAINPVLKSFNTSVQGAYLIFKAKIQ